MFDQAIQQTLIRTKHEDQTARGWCGWASCFRSAEGRRRLEVCRNRGGSITVGGGGISWRRRRRRWLQKAGCVSRGHPAESQATIRVGLLASAALPSEDQATIRSSNGRQAMLRRSEPAASSPVQPENLIMALLYGRRPIIMTMGAGLQALNSRPRSSSISLSISLHCTLVINQPWQIYLLRHPES